MFFSASSPHGIWKFCSSLVETLEFFAKPSRQVLLVTRLEDLAALLR